MKPTSAMLAATIAKALRIFVPLDWAGCRRLMRGRIGGTNPVVKGCIPIFIWRLWDASRIDFGMLHQPRQQTGRNDNGQAALEFYEKRRQWAEYASTHDKLTDRGFRVGFWLSRRMNGDDQCCWYSVPRIAKEMGLSVRSVQRGLADLKAANLIFVVEQKGKVSEYHLHAPFF